MLTFMQNSLRVGSFSKKPAIITILAVFLLCVFAAQLVRVARLYSANWDEAHHLYDGYMILTRHDYRANAEVPPLVKIVAALPLLSLKPLPPQHLALSQAPNAFLDGRAFVFGNGGDRLLFPARIACMLVSILTALLIFAAGRTMFGAWPGICALFLFVFDPNALAHGTLISTDMGSACFLLAGTYAFYHYAICPNWKWLLTTGFLAGLAMVVKFTGILIAPMLLAITAAEAIRRRSAVALGKLAAASIAILTCAWLVVWTFYGFRYAPAPTGLELFPALAPYLTSLPHKGDAAKLALIARFHLLPEAYIWGLANTRHMEWQYTSYFFGRVYRHGPWQYFPVGFLIKSTLPLLIFLLSAPVAWRSAGKPMAGS